MINCEKINFYVSINSICYGQLLTNYLVSKKQLNSLLISKEIFKKGQI